MKNSKQTPCSTCGGKNYNEMFEIPYVPSMVLADGGGIHIKPSHEGRFTEYKKRTGKTTEEALHSPDPHVRQMANFARNASHWKHAEGGVIDSEMPDPIKTFQMWDQNNNHIVTYGMNQTAQGPRFYKSSSPDMEFSKRNIYNTIRQNPADSIHRVNVPNIAMEEFLKKHQQGGATQQDQLQQLIVAYAQIHHTDPQQVFQMFSQLDPQKKQEVVKVMMDEVSQAQGAGQQDERADNNQMSQPTAPEMAYGGTHQMGPIGLGDNEIPNIVPAASVSAFDSPIMRFMRAPAAYAGLGAGVASSLLGAAKGTTWVGDKLLPEGSVKNGFDKVMNTTSNVLKGAVDLGTSFNTHSGFENQYKNPMAAADAYQHRPLDKKYIDQAHNAPGTPIKYSDIQSNDFTKSPDYNNNYGTMVAEYGGILPHAQFGIPEGFDFNDPYGLKKPRFGQTANVADTMNYQSQPVILQKPPMADDNGQMPDLTGLNPTLSKRQLKKQNAADTQYKIDQDNQIIGNNLQKQLPPGTTQKPNSNFNGLEYAMKGIAGLGTFNAFKRSQENASAVNDYNDMVKRTHATGFRGTEDYPNPFGNYTLNAGPASNFQLKTNVWAQDYGTTSKYGGQTKFKEGGEYQISHDELLQLMRDGAEIEFIEK